MSFAVPGILGQWVGKSFWIFDRFTRVSNHNGAPSDRRLTTRKSSLTSLRGPRARNRSRVAPSAIGDVTDPLFYIISFIHSFLLHPAKCPPDYSHLSS